MAKKNNLNLSSKVSKQNLSQEQLNKKISKVAYSLYEKRNHMPGNEVNDWLEAEKLVKQKLNSICG